jgi:hypothetical protein
MHADLPAFRLFPDSAMARWLADALSERRDCEVLLGWAQTATGPLPRTFELVRAIERLIYGLHQESATDQVDDKSLARRRLADITPTQSST